MAIEFLACDVFRSSCFRSSFPEQDKLGHCRAGALFLLFVFGTLVWRCLGKPCCCSSYSRQRASMNNTSPQLNSRHLEGSGEESVQYTSATELAAAIFTVLEMQRPVANISRLIFSENDCQ